MSQTKRYYWLKLKEDFFEDDTMRYIEEQENGIAYENFYLKLCLKSLRNDGAVVRLVGERWIPYDVKALSDITRVPLKTVKNAMVLFQKIGLVEVKDDGTIFMKAINEMIGKETNKAESMRRLRAKSNHDKELEGGNNVTQMLPQCYPDVTD